MTIAICGEAFGVDEERLNTPFVGVSGFALFQMLVESGHLVPTEYDRAMIANYWSSSQDPNYIALIWKAHPEFFLTNVFMFHPERNNLDTLCGTKAETGSDLPSLAPGKYIQSKYLPELSRLVSELQQLNPSLIIALGNTACWALLRNSGITKIRGTITASPVLPGIKVLPTYHPAAVLRDWSLRPVTIVDLMKAKRESAFREIRRPERTVYIEPSLDDLRWFRRVYLANAKKLAIDIETIGDQISCIGFAPSTSVAMVVPFVDFRKPNGSYWTLHEEIEAWEWVRETCGNNTPKVLQNSLFDAHRLWRGYGIRVLNIEDDTMLLSHSLHPEAPKSLSYLGSIHTNESSWKLDVRHSKTIKKEN